MWSTLVDFFFSFSFCFAISLYLEHLEYQSFWKKAVSSFKSSLRDLVMVMMISALPKGTSALTWCWTRGLKFSKSMPINLN